MTVPRALGVAPGGFRLDARALGAFLGGGERFLALFQFGDVAIEREQAAVFERLEVEFDVARRSRYGVRSARRRA